MFKEKDYWICFSAFPLIGPKKFKVLRDYFGSARKAWEAPKEDLAHLGFSEKLIASFLKHREKFDFASYFLRLRKLKVNVLTKEDKSYPENLKGIDDSPFLLYSFGEILPQDSLSLGVVGTRKITSYGREVTEKLVSELTASGLTIVSGLAYGVDYVAHHTALEMGGRTIGVWAGGLDTVRDGFRRNLVEKIIKSNQGAIISEFPLGFHPNRSTFPQRNRIIAGMSLGVLVTEAAEDSGSLITATQAGRYGRKVFAVPGPITSILSKGTAELIKSGAKLVYQLSDILEELDVKSKIKYKQSLSLRDQKSKMILPESEDEEMVLKILENETKHIDEIGRETGWEPSKTSSILTLMEMKGKIKNLGGMVYGINK